MEEIQGSFTALVTPFYNDKKQSVNYKKSDELIKVQASNGTDGIVVCGTTGESTALEYHEQEEIIRRAIEVCKPLNLKVINGVCSNNTQKAIKLAAMAHKLGIDASLIVPPFYVKPTQKTIVSYFQDLDQIGVPLIIYNIPSRTGVNIEPETILEIVDSCRNVIGLKASNGDMNQITRTAVLMKKAKSSFSILSGDDSLTLPILSIGGVGVISVAGNIIPKVMAKLISSHRQKSTEAARSIMYIIHAFSKSLLELGSSPAPIKAIMNVAGMDVGKCRKPLLDITRNKLTMLKQLEKVMKEEFKKKFPDLVSPTVN